MEKYTVGIYFNATLEKVVLILKNRPKWQAGKYNFPGGTIEPNEQPSDCIAREFKEECGIETSSSSWKYIGIIKNPDVPYEVHIFTIVEGNHKPEPKTMEDQNVEWIGVNKLPDNLMSNLYWMIPYAVNYWRQGNFDTLTFSEFTYRLDKF